MKPQSRKSSKIEITLYLDFPENHAAEPSGDFAITVNGETRAAAELRGTYYQAACALASLLFDSEPDADAVLLDLQRLLARSPQAARQRQSYPAIKSAAG